MKATYTLCTSDVQAATALWYKTWNPSPSYISKSAGALMLFLGAICLLGCLRNIEESFGPCVLAFAIAFLCFRLSSLQIRSHTRAFLAAWPEGKLEQSVDVTPNGLLFTGPSTRLEYAWGFYRAVTRHPEGLLLAGPGTLFHWIPARAHIEGGSWDEMERFLNGRIPSCKDVPT